MVELPVEPREAAGERADGVFIAHAHHHAHRQILERHIGLGDERLACRLERLRDADRIDNDIMRLGGRGRRRDLLEIVGVKGTRAASLHLLEVVAALHVAHEQQAFEGLHVRARGDHVHSDGDARVVAIAELRENGFRVFVAW